MHRLTALLVLPLLLTARPADARPAVLSPETLALPAADTVSADTTTDSAALRWARRAAESRRRTADALARATDAGRGQRFAEAFARYEAARATVASTPLAFPDEAAPFVERQRSVVESRFAAAVRQGRRLLPMIARALVRGGLPEELKYVAVIESSLNPAATSPAGAAGLWQFMPGTAAQYGLTASTVRDPARSTDAAVRFLDGLGRRFEGDWQLALAAYNCGPARVQRIVAAHRARTGTTPTFWDIRESLPAETRDYVARFIAAAQHFEG